MTSESDLEQQLNAGVADLSNDGYQDLEELFKDSKQLCELISRNNEAGPGRELQLHGESSANAKQPEKKQPKEDEEDARLEFIQPHIPLREQRALNLPPNFSVGSRASQITNEERRKRRWYCVECFAKNMINLNYGDSKTCKRSVCTQTYGESGYGHNKFTKKRGGPSVGGFAEADQAIPAIRWVCASCRGIYRDRQDKFFMLVAINWMTQPYCFACQWLEKTGLRPGGTIGERDENGLKVI